MTTLVIARPRQRVAAGGDAQHRHRRAEDRRRHPRARRRVATRRAAAQAAAAIAGVAKVLHADAPHLASPTARERRGDGRSPPSRRAAIRTCSRRQPASARTRCRASRRCSMSRRSPTSSLVESPDTFVRPIYAGSVLATVQLEATRSRSITVRATGFDAAAGERRQRRDRGRRRGAGHAACRR